LFLKAIEIFGFKSFPDKTRVEFCDGVTVIVGPNGCGKSNIFDAIRWVLGEKSAKALRGEHMEDVLFMGSDVLKPVGMCSVTLFMQNINNILPDKYGEVELTRKLYRDGQSEYLINKQPVLLKDLQDLFMDTGVGRNAYAFIEQGKVSQILSKRPEDRRTIFEEAAGISRYKARKTETLLKLDKTRDNLVRVRDILVEVERNRNNAKLNAEKAEKAKKLNDELKEKEILGFSCEFREYLDKLKAVEDRLKAQELKNAQLVEEISKLEEKNAEARQKLEQTRSTKHSSEKDIIHLQGRATTLNQRIEHLQAQINQYNHSIGEEKIRIGSVDGKKSNILEKVKSVEEQIEQNRQLGESTRSLRLATDNELRQLKTGLVASDKKQETFRREMERLNREIEKGRRKLKDVIDEFVRQIDSAKDDFLKSQKKREEMSVVILSLLDTVIQKVSGLAKEKSDLAAVKKGLGEAGAGLTDLRKKNREFLLLHDALQDLFLDKRGIHAQKENLEKTIYSMEQELSAAQNNISQLESEKKSLSQKEAVATEKIGELNTRMERLTADAEGYANSLEQLRLQVKEYDDQVAAIRLVIGRSEEEIVRNQAQIAASQKEYDQVTAEIKRMTKALTGHDQNLEGMNERIQQTDDRIKAKRVLLKEQEDRANHLKLEIKEVETKRNDLKTLLYENYGVNVEETVKKVTERTDIAVVRQQIQKLKETKNDLGTVNPLAIDEYKELNERFHFLQKQKADIEKAETEALEALKMLDEESKKMFLTTFKTVREHYIRITRKLFRGGKADLVLLNPDDPLNSDIDVIVQPPGKKTKLSQLSGGEKALSAIALIFSIFLTRPSPFCVMDEVDAPLDDQNVMRFVGLMKDFTEHVQFLLVTHNKQTMAAADLIYGVTMEEPAVSKIVSLQLNTLDKDKYQIQDLKDKEPADVGAQSVDAEGSDEAKPEDQAEGPQGDANGPDEDGDNQDNR